MARILAATIFALALSACTSNRRLYEGVDGGYLVASIGGQFDVRFPVYRFLYRSRDHKTEGSIRLPNVVEFVVGSSDFRSPAKWGVVTTARLSPGQYEIYNFEIALDHYGYVADREFSIPFTIEAGKTTYAGEYIANTGIRRDILGLAIATLPFKFPISNQRARDLEIAKTRAPELANLSVIDAVPDPAKLGVAYFVAGPRAQP